MSAFALHATARSVNARRSMMAYLAAQGFSGTIVDYNDARARSDATAPFIRVRITEAPAASKGPHPDGGKATMRALVLDCECWARGTDGEQVGALDAAVGLADQVDAALTYPANVEIFDYAAGISPAVTTGQYLQFTEAPTRTDPRAVDGWQQQIVTTQAFWFARKE